MSSELHREINNYQLLELIGSGGMSKVWRVRHEGSDQDLALKVIPVEDIASDFERRLRREPEIHHGLRHPNIVPLLDWFRDGDQFCLVMEYVPGKPLSRFIHGEAGWLSFAKARELLRGVLLAVQHLHQHGVVHRDIKPGNVLLDANGKPLLTDFGIAKFAWQQGETRTQKGLGTPEYMSPEQVRGTNIDHRTDIYSLGVTFFEMLTGRKPFARAEETPAHFAEVVGKILNQELPDPRQFVPGIPDGAVALLQKATQKDPLLRFQTCLEFLDALDMVDENVITPFRDPDATVVLNGELSAVQEAMHGSETVLPRSAGHATSRIQEEPVKSRDGSKRGLLISVILLVLAAGGYFGTMWYQQIQQEEMAKPLTKERAMEAAQDIARDYKRFSFDGNISALATLYATEGVEYFRMRSVGREEIRADAEKFFARIERTDRFDVEVNRVSVVNDSTFTTRWIIGYERLKDDGSVLRGEAVHEFTIKRFGNEWLIVREKQKSIRRNDQAPPPPDTLAVDTTIAQPEEPVEVVPVYPDEAEMRNAVKSVVLLANNGQAGQAWAQYASSTLKSKMGGFPDVISEGSLSLRTVSVDGPTATAIVAKSQGFTQKEVVIRFQFASGEGLTLTDVIVSE